MLFVEFEKYLITIPRSFFVEILLSSINQSINHSGVKWAPSENMFGTCFMKVNKSSTMGDTF